MIYSINEQLAVWDVVLKLSDVKRATDGVAANFNFISPEKYHRLPLTNSPAAFARKISMCRLLD